MACRLWPPLAGWLDFQRNHEPHHKAQPEQVGGTWIDVGGTDPNGGRINPLQVRVDAVGDDDDDKPHDGMASSHSMTSSHLAQHIRTLRTFFMLALEGVGHDELSTLEQALESLYARHGITWDTDAATIPNDGFPIMGDLYDHIMPSFVRRCPSLS